jgi:hypothetical protein
MSTDFAISATILAICDRTRAELAAMQARLAASLDPGDWDVIVAAALDRSAMVDGEPVTLTDSVLRAARRP